MKRTAVRISLAVTILVLPARLLAASDNDPAVRAGRWEFEAIAGGVKSNTVRFSDSGSGTEGSLEIKNSLLAGIRGEAHLNNYIGLALSFSFSRPDYEIRLSSPSSLTQTGDFTMNWIDGDLTWRFFPTRFTPFASAGIGAFNIAQKKITDSQGQAIFIAEQHFEYHGAGGFEWAMGDHLVLKASGRYARSFICCGNVGKHDLNFMEALFGVAYRSGPPRHHYGPF